jgi:hypothetical protein
MATVQLRRSPHVMSESADELWGHRDASLVDLIDRLLAGGVVIVGDVTLSVADVDLVHAGLQLLVSSISEDDETAPSGRGAQAVELLP